jgi:hypothetical protein
MVTFEERREEWLRYMDPDDIIEVLQIDADALLDRFEDRLIIYFEREYNEREG